MARLSHSVVLWVLIGTLLVPAKHILVQAQLASCSDFLSGRYCGYGVTFLRSSTYQGLDMAPETTCGTWVSDMMEASDIECADSSGDYMSTPHRADADMIYQTALTTGCCEETIVAATGQPTAAAATTMPPSPTPTSASTSTPMAPAAEEPTSGTVSAASCFSLASVTIAICILLL